MAYRQGSGTFWLWLGITAVMPITLLATAELVDLIIAASRNIQRLADALAPR